MEKFQNPQPFKCEQCDHLFGKWWGDDKELSYQVGTCPNCGSTDICGHNDDHEEDADATYLCIWGKGFPSTYPDMLQIECPSFFSTNVGYDVDDIYSIMMLHEGDAYSCPDGGHFIMRVQDGFNPENKSNPT